MAANNLGTAYIKIAPQMQGIQSEISKGLQGAIKSVAPATTAVGTVVSKGVSVAMNAVSNSLDRAITRVDALNAFPKIMQNLGFSTEESTSAINKLSDRIEGLPTGLDEIVIYTQRLASTMGNLNQGMYNATDLAIAFNDAALAGGKGQLEANRAFEQFSQVLSRGRPTMQDWKIMMEVMPGQLKQMAKYMGQNNDSLKEYAQQAGKTVDELDGMDLYNWISADKNEHARERLSQLTESIIDLDNKGGNGIRSFKDQVGDATHTIGNAMSLIPLRISKALAKVIQAFGSNDIYDAIDKFTKSFDGVGDWIAKNIVPVIKNTIIPALKNLLGIVKSFFEFIAKNKAAQSIIMGLVNAFIAFKTVKFVKGTLANITTGITSVLGAAKNAVSGVKTFATALKTGFNISDSFKLASMETTGLTSKITGLASAATASHGAVGGLVSSITTLGTAAGILGMVAADAQALYYMSNIEAIKAKTAMRNFENQCINATTAQRALNTALSNEKTILQEVKDALDAQDSAELNYIEAKKEATSLQENYNSLLRSGTASADDLREAEIKMNGAIKVRDEKQKEYNESLEKTKAAQEEWLGNQLTGIYTMNQATAAQEVISGKYALVASQLDKLSESTITYKDESGKLVEATLEDSQSMSDGIASNLRKISSTWDEIYTLSLEKGISLSEATAEIGKKSGNNLTVNFAMGIDAYTPLATDAANNTAQSVKNVMDQKSAEAAASGRNTTQNYANGIMSNINASNNAADTVGSHSLSKMQAATAGAYNVGKNMTQGAANGVEDPQAKGGLLSRAAATIRAAVAQMKAAAQEHSPSKATAEIGKFLSLGLAKGIDDYADEAIEAAEDMTNRTISAMNTDYNPGLTMNQLQPQTALTSGMNGSGGQVIQYNDFNVESELDVKEISKRLGWQVATAL